MKITCPHCSTVYNIDDSRISDKGLLVKCSVCENQYRIKKRKELPIEEDDIVGLFHSKMKDEPEQGSDAASDSETDNSDSSQVNDALPFDDDDDTASLFDDDDAVIETTDQIHAPQNSAPQLSDDEESPEITVNYIVTPPPSESDSKIENEVAEEKEPDMEDESSDSLFEDEDEEKVSDNIERFDLFGDKEESKGVEEDDFFSGIELSSDRYEEKTESPPLFEDDDSPGLFEDDPQLTEEDKGSEPIQRADEFIENLFNSHSSVESSGGSDSSIYFKKKGTGEIVGPFSEDQIEDLMVKGVISPDDDISYDGFSWESGSTPSFDDNDSFDHDLDIFKSVSDTGSISLGSDIDMDDFSESPNSSQTGLFSDAVASEFEGTSVTNISSGSIDHVFIPEELTDSGMEKTGPAKLKKKKKSGSSGVPFFAVLTVSTLVVLGLIGGGAYYYLNYMSGTKGDVLDNISESIAVHTGTLLDVREALDKDLPQDYIKSIGILRQYINPGERAPTPVGLDGQVKFNLIISYNRRIEPVSTTDQKINEEMAHAPDNIDLIKAKALSFYVQRSFDEAIRILQPHVNSDDPEIFYILGLAAYGKNDFANAETFFNTGFVKSNGKSAKITYALADMKYRNGDTQSAMAFINRVILENRTYLKAYLLKGQILMNNPDRLNEADAFLREVDSSIVATAEDFQKAQYFQMVAQVSQRKGNMKEAIANYERAVEINKTDTNSLTTIADFYVQTGNSSKGMEYYDAALNIDAKFPPAILGKAEVFTRIGQQDRVYLELAKLDIKSIKEPDYLLRLGKIYYELGDRGKSLEYFDLAIAANPSMIEPYLSKAVILLESKKLDGLKEISEKLGVLGKDTYAYNLVRAIVFHEEGNHRQAEIHYETSLKRNSQGDERVFYHYGMLLYDQQKYAQASRNLERAYKVSPRTYKYLQSYVESLEKERKWGEVKVLLEGSEFRERPMFRSYVSLSNAFYETRKYQEALNNINRAIDLHSGNSYLHYLKARILYAMEKYSDAEIEINKAVVLDMSNFDNYMMYARILIRRGDFKGAIDRIEAAEKIDPKNESLMLLKGIVYKSLDDYRNAILYFRRVKSTALRKEAYLEIGETYLNVNNTREALKYLRLAEKEGNPNAHKYLARIYYETGKIDTAVQYYRKSLRADKNDVQALRQLGFIYKEKGEYPRALSHFNRYLKLITDPFERKMIEDEIFFLNRNLTEAHKKTMRDDSTLEMDEEDINERAKELYLEGRALRIEDPELAREKFREIMKIVPKDNEYYQKAFRSFNRLGRDDD